MTADTHGIRLQDYKFYPATFEPCEVQGSKEGYKAIVHADAIDIITYGVNYDNTIKMAQSVVTDMAHAMSLEELIPAAQNVAKLNVPEPEHHTHGTDNQPHALNSPTSANLLDLQAEHLRSLAQMMAADVKSPDLAEPTYVRSLSPNEAKERRAGNFMVAIELPTQTALKIVIINYMLTHHYKLSTLAEEFGCKKAELERKLDFYQDTNIYDLKLIISILKLQISDLDELLALQSAS